MLPKGRRLTRHDFPKDHREGLVVHSAHLSVRCTKKMVQESRFSAVISKKVAVGSPARHLWKRRVYEIIKSLEKDHPLPFGAYVFFAKKDAHKLSYKALTEEIEGLLRQVV